jgi:hypothetical protein
MVQRREDLCFTPEPGEAFGIVREQVGQDLEGHVSPELRIAGAIHLAHASGAQRRVNLVGAQARTGGQGHAQN